MTDSAIRQILIDDFFYSEAKSKLRQHRILMSNVLQNHYEEYFDAHDELFLFKQWIQSVSYYDALESPESLSEDYNNELSSQMQQIPHSIVIYKEEEPANGCVINYISVEDINNTASDNELSRYCIPTGFFVRKNEDLGRYRNWIKEMLSEEKKIVIIDAYIYSSTVAQDIVGFYMPLFSPQTKVDIYYANDRKVKSELISRAKQKYKQQITNHPSNPEDFHDRYIYGEKIVIQIGIGLDLFESSKEPKARKETHISLGNNGKPTIPRVKV